MFIDDCKLEILVLLTLDTVVSTYIKLVILQFQNCHCVGKVIKRSVPTSCSSIVPSLTT